MRQDKEPRYLEIPPAFRVLGETLLLEDKTNQSLASRIRAGLDEAVRTGAAMCILLFIAAGDILDGRHDPRNPDLDKFYPD